MAQVDVWPFVEERRRGLADELTTLGDDAWDVASWCDGWTVRDVVAHLVHLAESSRSTVLGEVARSGFRPDRALDRAARQVATAPTSALISRLRAAAGGRFHAPFTPPEVAVGELLVHAADIFGPLGRSYAAPVEMVVPVLPVYRRFARLGYHARAIKKVRLVATDTDWAAGSGPEVLGTALDLVLTMANRSAARASLSGPGVGVLAAG